MVRRKEDLPAREVNVRVAKKVSQPVEDDEPMPKLRRPLKIRRRGGAGKTVITVLVIVLLLAGGWFAARAAVIGMDLMNGGQSSWLATLFNIKVTKLIGETDGRVNILLMGIPGDPKHDGPDLTDTLMVASYNTTDKIVHLFSIPRDLQVTGANNVGTMKINAVYQTGQSQSGDGAGTLTKTVEGLTGLTIPYYIRIDFAGFKQLVDELGGVKVEVKKDLSDPNYPADTGTGVQLFEVKAGSYTMDGEMALKYARSRHSTSDFDRARRQQDIILALKEKAQELDLLTVPAKMLAINDIIKDHLATNLNKDELTRLMQLIVDLTPSNVINKVMDESSGLLLGGKNEAGAYVLQPKSGDYNSIKEFVTNALTQTTAEPEPAAEEVAATPLKIEILNGTTTTGLAAKAAEKLKAAGYTVVRVGNNATKGVAKTTIYGNGDEKVTSALQGLATAAGGTVSADKVTLPSTTEARVVLGADYPTQ
jgi:LCP family protein required for cell wall assembly